LLSFLKLSSFHLIHLTWPVGADKYVLSEDNWSVPAASLEKEMEEKHLEILLEDISGKFDLVLEGHDVLRHEIQRTREELSEKIDLNTTMIKALNEKIDGVDQRLSAKIDLVDQRLCAKIDSVDQRLCAKIDSVDQRFNAKIDAVDKRLGDKLDVFAADLADHRQDTELHGHYRVCEKP
jgi:hypothetical protein